MERHESPNRPDRSYFNNRARIRQRQRERRRRAQRRLFFTSILLLLIIAGGSYLGISSYKRSHNPEQKDLVVQNDQNNIAASSPSPNVSPDTSASPSAFSSPQIQLITNGSIPADQSNDMLKIYPDNGDKICYLTFDDGPTNSITPQILDTLRKYNIKATFFEVGSLIKANPDMARRVYEEGHLIANHSYKHEYKELYATEDSFMTEITQTDELIQQIMDPGEEHFKLIRFPGGSYNAGSYGAKKQQYKESLKEAGYYYADWNALSGDAEGGKKTADQLVEYTKKTAGTKNKVVILMHDAANKQNTADALPRIIEYFIGQGYQFARMDEI